MRTRATHKVDSIMLNAGLHSCFGNFRTAKRNRVWIVEWPYVNLVQSLRIETSVPSCKHFTFVFFGWIVNENLELETIELRLRQWISSFVFDRVFRRQHCEDRRQGICFAVNRYLALFHRLEECGLRFWWRAIYFVGKKNIGEDWTASQVESRSRDVEDVGAGYVRRHQIGRELYATETGVDDSRECFDRQSFCSARHAFDQRMALREQGNQDLFDHVVLSDDDLA